VDYFLFLLAPPVFVFRKLNFNTFFINSLLSPGFSVLADFFYQQPFLLLKPGIDQKVAAVSKRLLSLQPYLH